MRIYIGKDDVVIDKTVKRSGTSGCIYVPKEFIGMPAKVVIEKVIEKNKTP